MNPVLLKPQSDIGAQVVVQGRVFGSADGARLSGAEAAAAARRARELRAAAGATPIWCWSRAPAAPRRSICAPATSPIWASRGPPDVPVVLVGDIDRGGVIAQIVGTQAVLDAGGRGHDRGFIVNKFRGDPSLFADGMQLIAERTGWRALGLVPFFAAAAPPARRGRGGARRGARDGKRRGVTIAVPLLPRIANFDDLDPLRLEPDVRLVMRPPGRAAAALPISSSCRARRRPSPISRSARRGLGHRHPRPCPARRHACSAFAAAIRCSGAHRRSRGASKGRPATVAGPRPARRRDGADRREDAARRRRACRRQRRAVHRLRDACRPHRRDRIARGRCCASPTAARTARSLRRARHGRLRARALRRRRAARGLARAGSARCVRSFL